MQVFFFFLTFGHSQADSLPVVNIYAKLTISYITSAMSLATGLVSEKEKINVNWISFIYTG